MGRKKKYHTEEERLEAKRLARKKYRENNKEKVAKQVKNWCDNNLDKRRENYLKNKKELTKEQKEERKIYMKEYLKTYKDKIKQRMLNDPLFRITCSTRSLINGAIKRKGYTKSTKTEKILGCSFDKFKQHIESQWEDWMNWDNYGLYNGNEKYGWDIYHIIPTSSALNEGEVIKLNHFTNLQPLCSKINRDIKKDII